MASMSTSATATTGTRFLARTSETVAIMTTADPGGSCAGELQYGIGQ